MVQATDTVELRLVIDRAEIEKQLSAGFDAAVGKAPKARPGGRPGGGMSNEDWAELKAGRAKKKLSRDEAELGKMRDPEGAGGGSIKKPRGGTKVAPGPKFMQIFKPLAALEIIKFGIKTMVKNSKIISTTMNAFGQILGAMLDMFLLPFLPFLLKIFRVLIGWLPKIREMGQAVFNAIESGWDAMIAWWNENGLTEDEMSRIGQMLKEELALVWEIIKTTGDILKVVLNQIVDGITVLVDAFRWVAKKFGYKPSDAPGGEKEGGRKGPSLPFLPGGGDLRSISEGLKVLRDLIKWADQPRVERRANRTAEKSAERFSKTPKVADTIINLKINPDGTVTNEGGTGTVRIAGTP